LCFSRNPDPDCDKNVKEKGLTGILKVFILDAGLKAETGILHFYRFRESLSLRFMSENYPADLPAGKKEVRYEQNRDVTCAVQGKEL
jgi:hypothetical protein